VTILGAVIGTLAAGCTSPRQTPESADQPPSQSANQPSDQQGQSMLTAEERAAGWRPLFDGKTTAGWRGFRQQAVPAGWQVRDGALTRVGEGSDIVTVDQFENFELALEWKVAPGGNSGIMYRVTEDLDHTYESGPEMQVLDDAAHRDGQSRLTAAGALYGLYASPPGVVKPGGEWNAVRIVANGGHVEHWLNGVKVVDYELWSPDWETRVRDSKFKDWPKYGRARRGHIALQDHGDWVAYRAIKIRELP
jgi:hypothetical protein